MSQQRMSVEIHLVNTFHYMLWQFSLYFHYWFEDWYQYKEFKGYQLFGYIKRCDFLLVPKVSHFHSSAFYSIHQCTVPENECEAFAVLWSKTANFRGAWHNVNMQPLPWAPTALIPHIRAFKRGI